MQAVLGPFHPHLEDALAEEIRCTKKKDLLCPLLVVVPSDSLRRHLKQALVRGRKQSFVNLQVLTFRQLSLKLFDEAHGAATPTIHEDFFFEEALRQMIRARVPGTAPFAGIEQKAGGCAALWQTLRDLRDGLVDPAVALEALREGHFAQSSRQRTLELLALLQSLVLFCEQKHVKDQADLERAAAAGVPQSAFLRQFRRIFYYGFYDLTQAQLEFFHAVAQNYEITLFFPLIGGAPPHDGWSFAQRFYERHLEGRGSADRASNELVGASGSHRRLPATFGLFDQEPQRRYDPMPADWRCTIFNSFGIHDEVSAVAKEILRLVDGEGMQPCDIGVVARTLDGYGAVIKEVFQCHNVPIAAAIEEPLVQFPLTKATVLLLNLKSGDYLRAQVIDLVSSPYFDARALRGESFQARPDLWDLATRELAICRGLQEWQRLGRFADKDLVISYRGRDQQPPVIPAAQLRALAAIVNSIAAALSQLPDRASWSHYASAWRKLLQRHLKPSRGAAGLSAADALVSDKILAGLEEMARLDTVQADVPMREFCNAYQRWLERSTIVTTDPNTAGVAVLNGAAARGLSFRALFVVGMNEGAFPRTIREDAFLRDRERDVIERDLGYKVSQKLAGFDEEKLLFCLLTNAAKERLYCSFQRADEEGRALNPSWYLAELKRALAENGMDWLEQRTIPRSTVAKAGIEPFNREGLLLPEELAVRASLAGEEAGSLITAANLSPNLFHAGLRAIQEIELSTDRLNAFDGIVSRADSHWERLAQHGVSPTALEAYARCPFQYFTSQVLGLERLARPEDAIGPSAAEYGELGHEILKRTYQELIDRGYFAGDSCSGNVAAVLAAAAAAAFADYERDHPIGYPLAWETLRSEIMGLIHTVVERDLEELRASGYKPVAVEAAAVDCLPPDWPHPLGSLPVRGRMDRVDWDASGNRLRIVDYKFKLGPGALSSDRDLYKAALRAQRLQPPIYLLLGRRWAEIHCHGLSQPRVEAAFYYIAPRWSDGPLVSSAFNGEAAAGAMDDEIKSTLADLLSGIRAGSFFLQRGPQCGYCEVTEICRKNHSPSLWRAEHDAAAERHRRVRAKNGRSS